MDEAWRRVTKELADRRKNLTWLAQKIGCDRPRVYGWQARKALPESAYREVAAALGKTPNWLAGIEDASGALLPMSREIVRAFEKIENDAARLAAFVQIIETCALAADSKSGQARRGRKSEPPSDTPPGWPLCSRW